MTDTESTMDAIRQPVNNSPVTDVTSSDITCNINNGPGSETAEVAAGSDITFLLDNTLYHQGKQIVCLPMV